MRIALFSSDQEHSRGSHLLTWAAANDLQVFSDFPHGKALHYLQFSAINRENSFDLVLYKLANTVQHSQFFFYLLKYPGVVFLDSAIMDKFVTGVSFAANDPWGTAWILDRIAPESSKKIVNLIEHEIADKNIWRGTQVGKLFNEIAVSVVVPDEESAITIGKGIDGSMLSIIDPDNDQDLFFGQMERNLPEWIERRRCFVNKMPKHPNYNIIESERARLDESSVFESEMLTQIALDQLQELLTPADQAKSVLDEDC